MYEITNLLGVNSKIAFVFNKKNESLMEINDQLKSLNT